MKEMIQNGTTLLGDPVGEPHLAGFHLILKIFKDIYLNVFLTSKYLYWIINSKIFI